MMDILLFRRGRPTDDAEAVFAAEGRRVSCFLRAEHGDWPRRFKPGQLTLRNSGVTWSPGIYGRGLAVNLPPDLRAQAVQPVDGPGAWNIKKHLFQMVITEHQHGRIYLAVPRGSVQLVLSRLRTDA
jgi:hypothetical protein